MKNFSVGLIIFLALVHGIVYLLLIPPWQHYDEPSHFEYVWWIASKGALPDVTSLDLEFRRQLIQSMIANQFYKGVATPDVQTIEATTSVYGLGFSQLDEPPLYYILASIPVRLLQGQNPAVQLISARIISLGLFLLTIIAIWEITNESTGPGSSLRLWVPLSAALLPGFVDVMTAVNNDVGAVFAFSFFLWGSVRYLNRKRSLLNVVWIVGSTIICLGMKSTAFLAAPLSLFVLGLAFVTGTHKRWIGMTILLLCVAGLLGIFTWRDASHWHRATTQELPTRAKVEMAPLGEFALQVDSTARTTPTWLRPLQQPLTFPEHTSTVTFGVWMWHSGDPGKSVETRTPILNTEHSSIFETILVNSTPSFYAFETNLPPDANRLWITIAPPAQGEYPVIYYDGFVLAEGKFSTTEPPGFNSPNGTSGSWGGIEFHNLVRNPSAESSWPSIRTELDNQFSKVVPDNARISMLLFGVMDWERTYSYFTTTARHLMESFWGRFGWGHVMLVPPVWYLVLGFVTVLGGVGAGIGLVRRARFWEKRHFFLALVTGLIWTITSLRGEIFIFTSDIFIPGARYAYPVIAPTLLIFIGGWREWGRLTLRLLPALSIDRHVLANIIGGLWFFVLDISSLYSIFRYFGR